jgi:hypothetical protein
MQSISARFPDAQNLSYHIRGQISSLEVNLSQEESVDLSLQTQVTKDLEELNTTIQELIKLSQKEGPRKDAWRSRISQLEGELDVLRTAYRKISRLLRDKADRRQLFGTTQRTRAPESAELYRQEHESLANSTKMVNNIDILSELLSLD